MKKYIFLIGFIGYSYCTSGSPTINMQILIGQLQLASQNLLKKVQDLTAKETSRGGILDEIKKGKDLRKTSPNIRDKPAEEDTSVTGVLLRSDVLRRAAEKEQAKKSAQNNTEGASQEEWEASENVKPSAPVISKKTAEEPTLPKNFFGNSLPELKFNPQGKVTEISNALANYLTLLDAYLDYNVENKSTISDTSKNKIKRDEESVDAIPDEKYSKTQKLLFHTKNQELRKKYAGLNLLPYTPKPITPKPTILGQPTQQPAKAPVDLPKKPFTPITADGGDLLSQIAGAEKD